MPLHLSPLRPSTLLLALALLAAPLAAQEVEFTSSNLPIVIVDTDGQTIPDEPKIAARMRIIDNGPGARNHLTDPANDYDGYIGIEIRGSSSQMYPKKQYGVETWDAAGEDIDVSLLGFPEEEDWILHAPYSDKSLMRNVLVYRLARAMGHYASRTRFCELVLDGSYQGIYILMEKIKRDNNRVDISKLNEDEISGDDLTGGYLLQIDRREEGWSSGFLGVDSDWRPYYQYREPDADDIVPEQERYIQLFIRDFEVMMASLDFDDPQTGYPSLLDLDSFVDFFLLNEISKNVDGYRLSSYLYKDKDSNDPRLHAGPVWDFNLAFGNADYYDGALTAGLQVHADLQGDEYPIPFWWPKLVGSEPFESAAKERWSELRDGLFHEDSLMQRIDGLTALLEESRTRNFERWPVLDQYVWPNAYIGGSYAAEVAYLKGWIRDRLAWMDAEFDLAVATAPMNEAKPLTISSPSPNPAFAQAELRITLPSAQHVRADLYDVLGRRVAVLEDRRIASGSEESVKVDAASLPAGLYVIHLRGETFRATRTLLVAR